MSAIIRPAVDVKLFQLLEEAGDAGLTPSILSEKTKINRVFLRRLMSHLVTLHIIIYRDGAFHATPLSNGLAEEKY